MLLNRKRGVSLPSVLLFPGNGGEGRDEENERERVIHPLF